MSTSAPNARLHHVVFCVRPENQERAADFWRGLGMTFSEVPLADEGIRVLLDWSAGIELVSPSEPEGTETARFWAFLNERGEGPYSVVVRTGDLQGPLVSAEKHGASVCYQQHRETGDVVVDEAELTPIFGMAVTLLNTNLPD
jgi:hypothetical protein